MNRYAENKKEINDCCKRLVEKGVFYGTGGNVSRRIPNEDKIAITPTSMDYLVMKAEDICICDFEGSLLEGSYNPSIETMMHIAVYKNRPDIKAVVHTHQPYASTFAITGNSIPALFDEQVLLIGPSVEVVPYAMSGSDQLAENVGAAVSNRCNAFILKNHGVLILGFSIKDAEHNAALLEKTAHAYINALAMQKGIEVLSDEATGYFFDKLKKKQDRESCLKNG